VTTDGLALRGQQHIGELLIAQQAGKHLEQIALVVIPFETILLLIHHVLNKK
jgi:hypothetical protein